MKGGLTKVMTSFAKKFGIGGAKGVAPVGKSQPRGGQGKSRPAAMSSGDGVTPKTRRTKRLH